MRRVRSILLGVSLVLLACGCTTVRLDDRTSTPLVAASALELVAELADPPGNVAVSREGRVFLSLHPSGRPENKVVEIVRGRPVPYPNAELQRWHRDGDFFDTVLGLRVDRQDRLWTLDFGSYGFGTPRLLCFDLASDELIYRYDFPADVAGPMSMLNDLQIDPTGRWVYISETSPILKRPAIVVHDTETGRSRRVLARDRSVRSGPYAVHTSAGPVKLLGLFPMQGGVDGIALDDEGRWLYYAALTGDRLYRVATRDLDDASLPEAELARRVEDAGPKTITDGLGIDSAGDVYLTDPEHGAILSLGRDRVLATQLRAARLRWPDGLSFAPGGWLYVSCSALDQVVLKSRRHIARHAPFQVFRFRPVRSAVR